MIFGIAHFGSNNNVCGNDNDSFLQLPTWVIVNAAIEIIIICLLLSYNINTRGILRLYSLYVISLAYFAWLIIGFYLLCNQCLSSTSGGGDYKPEGSIFIIICLLAGMILCLINLKVIDFLDHVRFTTFNYYSPLLEVPLVP